jgi:Ca2+-binding EF-hand superfamily protein
MKTLTLPALALTAVLTLSVLAADPPQATDVQDFVFLAEARPLLVRLHVRCDGKPPQAAWDDCMKYLFDYLDINSDGVLSKDEAERAPSIDQLFGGINGRGRGPGAGPKMDDLDTDKDGMVSRDELAAYYRKHGFVPFQFQLETAAANPLGGVAAIFGGARPEPGVEAVNKAIFQLLDPDKTGKLTNEKLAAAAELLLKLDEDEDEMLTTRELVPDSGASLGQLAGMMAMGGRQGKTDPTASSPTLVPILKPGTVPADLLKRMKDRYAKDEDKKLTQKALGLADAIFRPLDANNDGELDDQEVAAFVQRTPDLELAIHLGKTEGATARVELMTGEDRSPLAGQVQMKEGLALLDLGRTRAELRAGGGERPDRLAGFLRQQAIGQFKQADTNGDGFVDAKEAAANRSFRDVFKAIDRTGAGKVSEKELFAYLDHVQELQKRASAACVTLNLTDQSRGLFDLLDTNRDGRLSVRELRQAPRLLEQFDRDGKGYLTRDDIPRSYRLELHRGPGTQNRDPGRAFFDAYTSNSGTTEVRSSSRGPLWFRKMDRNRDGDVSRKEFLFGDELFRAIDTDGDGLISVEEAERYDALHRKEK